MEQIIKIAGAGPSGLSCAITLAHAGKKVEIWDIGPTAGNRFNNGFQILENYQSPLDVLQWLGNNGFSLDFSCYPQKSISVYDHHLNKINCFSKANYGYFIKRGPGIDTLDSSLVKQAESLGVIFHWNTRLDPLQADVIGTGSRIPSGISREMVFETDIPDTFWVLRDNTITPLGYAYLFVINRIGTIGTAILKNFSYIGNYFEEVVERFQGIHNFPINQPLVRTSHVGFFLPTSARRGHQLLIGEAAGFQDFLFGLAIRRSMLSGYLAAKSIIENSDYDALWKKEFETQLKAGIVNRFLYEIGGNVGFRLFLRAAHKRDFRSFGLNLNRYTFLRKIAFRIITGFLWKKPTPCSHGTECSWCKPTIPQYSRNKKKVLPSKNHSPSLREAYDYCRNLTISADTNFALGFRFLPKEKRQAIYAVYAFNRFADDYVDEAEYIERGAHLIEQWKKRLEACYSGYADSHLILKAFTDAVHRFRIPKEPFLNAIEGFKMDLTINRYQTFEDLLKYCERVAGTISEMSLPIFGFTRREAFTFGYSLSMALQLTNIIRDISKDIEKDRIYIPQDELYHFGYTEENLQNRVLNNNFRTLMKFQVGRAKSYFQAANPLVNYVEPDARLTTLLIGSVYVRILQKIEENNYDVFNNTIALTRSEKIRITLQKLVDQKFI